MRLITPPAVDPVTLADAVAHLHIEHTEDDAYISGLIKAAAAYVESDTGRRLITQTWTLYLPEWRQQNDILAAPVQAVDEVRYYGADGESAILDPAVYLVHTSDYDASLDLADGQQWPDLYNRRNPIELDVIVGYGDNAEAVPPDIRHAMLLLIGHWYTNREAVHIGATPHNLPIAVESLLSPHRMQRQ